MNIEKILDKTYYLVTNTDSKKDIKKVIVAGCNLKGVFYYDKEKQEFCFAEFGRLCSTLEEAKKRFKDIYVYVIRNHFANGEERDYKYYSTIQLLKDDFVICYENDTIGIVKNLVQRVNELDFKLSPNSKFYKKVAPINEAVYNIKLSQQRAEYLYQFD